MKRQIISGLLITAFCSLAVAADKDVALAVKQPKPESQAQIAFMADQLMTMGSQHKEPLYLLAAAALYRDSISGNSTPESRQTLQAIVDRAAELANGNEAVVAQGEAIVNDNKRAILASITEKRGLVAQSGQVTYFAEFEGGKDTSVSLVLDPIVAAQINRKEVDLDLFVRDAENRDICSQQGPGIPEFCAWTPRVQGKFSIQLVNTGKTEVPFVLYFDK